MKTYYNILDTIKNQLLQDNDCNSVTEGSIWEIDLDKQTIAPLSHIQVNNATRQGSTYVFNISVFCMDIVDKNPKATINKFRGNDNEQDVLNTQLAVGARLVELMERGDLRDDNFALSGEPTFESFTERFENFWAGWTVTFDVQVPNEMTICDNVIPSGDCPDATYTITDLDGNTLYTGTIASGFSTTQEINNSTAVLKNTLGTTISTTEILAEGSEEITAPNALVGLLNSEGSVIGGDSFPSGTASNMTAPDGMATNSNATYSLSVPSGGISSLPDVTNIDSDGLPVVTPAQTPFVCTPCGGGGSVGMKLMKTGRTVSYLTGDDGDLQNGRDTDFFTLDGLNGFGTNARFTDELGNYVDSTSYYNADGSPALYYTVFLNKVMIDWSTYDGVNVLGYYYNEISGTNRNFSDYLAWCSALSVLSLSWRAINKRELENLINPDYQGVTKYPPISSLGLWGGSVWSNTNHVSQTNYYYKLSNYGGSVSLGIDTGVAKCVAARNFTLAELGL